MRIYKNIQQARLNINMSRAQMAKKLGITQQIVRDWETGRRVIPSDMLLNMARLCCCTTDYLLSTSQSRLDILQAC